MNVPSVPVTWTVSIWGVATTAVAPPTPATVTCGGTVFPKAPSRTMAYATVPPVTGAVVTFAVPATPSPLTVTGLPRLMLFPVWVGSPSNSTERPGGDGHTARLTGCDGHLQAERGRGDEQPWEGLALERPRKVIVNTARSPPRCR